MRTETHRPDTATRTRAAQQYKKLKEGPESQEWFFGGISTGTSTGLCPACGAFIDPAFLGEAND